MIRIQTQMLLLLQVLQVLQQRLFPQSIYLASFLGNILCSGVKKCHKNYLQIELFMIYLILRKYFADTV